MRIFSATLATDRNSRLLGLRTTAALILMLGLATLTTGWRKSDTLGAAVGIGQQLAPAVLEAKQANAKHKAAEKNRPEAETLCIEKIKSDPDSTFDLINEFVHTYGAENVDSLLGAIRYTDWCSESEAIPLYKEEIYSGSSYPYIRFISGNETEGVEPYIVIAGELQSGFLAKPQDGIHPWDIAIEGKPFMPAIFIKGGSNYPAFAFFFLGDIKEGEEEEETASRSSCALFGLAQTFPAGTDVKDVGMRARQKYNASFKMESSNVEVKKFAEGSPYSYSYLRSTLVLSNETTIVKLICGTSNSFNMVKIDKEEFRKKYFGNPDVNLQIKLNIGMTYGEIKSFIENPDNKYKMGYEEINAFYTGLNKGFESVFNEELPAEKLQEIKDEAGQVTMQVFDSNLIMRYRDKLLQAENEQREAARVAEEKAAAEKEAQRKKALEF